MFTLLRDERTSVELSAVQNVSLHAGCLQKHPVIIQTALPAAARYSEMEREVGPIAILLLQKKKKIISIGLGNSSGDGEMLRVPSRSASDVGAAWSTNQCQTTSDCQSGNIFMGRS